MVNLRLKELCSRGVDFVKLISDVIIVGEIMALVWRNRLIKLNGGWEPKLKFA